MKHIKVKLEASSPPDISHGYTEHIAGESLTTGEVIEYIVAKNALVHKKEYS